MKLDSRLPRFLSQNEATKLVQAAETSDPGKIRDRALLELIYGAGLRVSEARDLDVVHLNLGARELRVVGKGSKERVVLIGVPAQRRAVAVPARRPPLSRRRRLRRRPVPQPFREDGSASAAFSRRFAPTPRRPVWEAGVHPHTLRHSYRDAHARGAAPTSESSRSCSATPVQPQPRYTRTSPAPKPVACTRPRTRARLPKSDPTSTTNPRDRDWCAAPAPFESPPWDCYSSRHLAAGRRDSAERMRPSCAG